MGLWGLSVVISRLCYCQAVPTPAPTAAVPATVAGAAAKAEGEGVDRNADLSLLLKHFCSGQEASVRGGPVQLFPIAAAPTSQCTPEERQGSRRQDSTGAGPLISGVGGVSLHPAASHFFHS